MAAAVEGPSAWEYRESRPDPAEYFELFETTGWNREYRLTPEELQDALRRSWLYIGVYDRGRLIATGRVISDGVAHALILDVIVRPEYQGRGLGTGVMRRLLDDCEKAGIRDLQLFCARGKSPFYRRLGFVSRPEDAPGMDYRPTARSRAGSALGRSL